MFLKRTGVLLLACTVVSGVLAAEPTATPNKHGKLERDDLICTYEKTTGSNIKRRVCATREQREEQRRRDQDAMQNLQGRGGGRSSGDPSTGL